MKSMYYDISIIIIIIYINNISIISIMIIITFKNFEADVSKTVQNRFKN